MEETPVPETTKRKPRADKGVKRGPRVKAPPIVVRAVPRILPVDDEPPPVKVIVDGEEIRCNAWAFEGGFLKLSYWPENRGRKGVRYIAISGIKDLRVEQPREMAEPSSSNSVMNSPAYPGTMIPMANVTPVEAAGGYVNPIMAARREKGVIPAEKIPDNTGGLNPRVMIVFNEVMV